MYTGPEPAGKGDAAMQGGILVATARRSKGTRAWLARLGMAGHQSLG